MPKVSIGSHFFKRSRLEYRDWVSAVIREFIQNSQDAGASLVEFTLVEKDNDHSVLTCKDNGRGMDRETLERVFFALGETSKRSDGSVGGFGKARELTCFSMDGYSIRTRHLSVYGEGDEYSIDETGEYVDGCEFQIQIDASYNRIQSAIKSYFSYSNPLCSVIFNGQKVQFCEAKKEHIRDLSFAKVFVDKKSELINNCVVRVNGLMMYNRYISAKTAVYIELDSERSRELLTANRDGISGDDINTELDRFFNELAVDVRSALMKKNRNKTTLFTGENGFKTVMPHNFCEEKNVETRTMETFVGSSSFTVSTSYNSNAISNTNNNTSYSPSYNMFDYYNIYLFDETEDTDYYSKMRSVIDKYSPLVWQKENSLGGNRSKLIRMWYAACEFCAEIFMEHTKRISPLKFGVGWIFSDTKNACCLSRNVDNSSVHFFCLCPVDMQGNMKYSICKKEDMHKMAFIALHEICHIADSFHNEDFANNLTYMSSILSSRMNECIHRMKNSLVMQGSY